MCVWGGGLPILLGLCPPPPLRLCSWLFLSAAPQAITLKPARPALIQMSPTMRSNRNHASAGEVRRNAHNLPRPPSRTAKIYIDCDGAFPRCPGAAWPVSHFRRWRLDSWIKALLFNENAPWWTILTSENTEDLISTRSHGPEDLKIQPVVSRRIRKLVLRGTCCIQNR